MSYDLYIFKLRPGVTVEDARVVLGEAYSWGDDEEDEIATADIEEVEGDQGAEIISIGGEEAHDHEQDGGQEEEEEEDDKPIAAVADPDLTDERIVQEVGRAWVRAFAPEERSPALTAWLEGDDEDVPANVAAEVEGLLATLDEWQSPPGALLLAFGGGDIDDTLVRFHEFAHEIRPLGYLICDPQAGGLIDVATDGDLLQEGGARFEEFLGSILEALQGDDSALSQITELQKEGASLFEAGEPQQAAEKFREALKLAVENEVVEEGVYALAEMLATAEAESGRFQEAIAVCRQVIGEDGEQGSPRMALLAGICHYNIEEIDEAKALLGRALEEGGVELIEEALNDAPPELIELAEEGLRERKER